MGERGAWAEGLKRRKDKALRFAEKHAVRAGIGLVTVHAGIIDA